MSSSRKQFFRVSFDPLKKKRNSGILWPEQFMAGGSGAGQNPPPRSSRTERETDQVISKLVYKRGPQYFNSVHIFNLKYKADTYFSRRAFHQLILYSAAYFSTKHFGVWDREDHFSYPPRRQDSCVAVFVLLSSSSEKRN